MLSSSGYHESMYSCIESIENVRKMKLEADVYEQKYSSELINPLYPNETNL